MEETTTDHWDRLPSGAIEIHLLEAWETAAAPGVVLLRLEILQGGKIATAQLVLDAAEATEMAKSLAWMAERSRSSHPEGQA